jgi:hypothetical protein
LDEFHVTRKRFFLMAWLCKFGGIVVKKAAVFSLKLVAGRLAIWTLSACLFLISPVFAQQPPTRSNAPGTNRTESGGDGANQVRPRIGPDVIVAADEDYRLSPSDVIEVIIQDAPELSGNFQISSSGNIPMYYLGSMKVEGRTRQAIQQPHVFHSRRGQIAGRLHHSRPSFALQTDYDCRRFAGKTRLDCVHRS